MVEEILRHGVEKPPSFKGKCERKTGKKRTKIPINEANATEKNAILSNDFNFIITRS
jgi:hypothetical protein